MSDLPTNIDALITLYATVSTQIQNSNHVPSPPEAAALQRLKESGILVPKKGRQAKTRSNTKDKAEAGKVSTSRKTEVELDKIADDRIDALLPDTLPPALTPDELVELLLHPGALATPEEEDDLVLEMMRGFAAPEAGWGSILTAAGVNSSQRITIETVTAAAAAKVPGQAVALVTAESNLLSFIKTNYADAYAAERILLCEAMYTQQAWNKLSPPQKGAHNRNLYMAQNPTIFDMHKTDEQKHKTLIDGGEHWAGLNTFLRKDRELLTRSRSQVSNFAQVFGLAAVIHPAVSISSLGRRALTLSRVSKRLHIALQKRPELRREIEARADANLKVIHDFVSGMVVAENKDPVCRYLTAFPSRVPPYKY